MWGVGYGEKRALEMRESWGLNLLGKALEEVRGVVRKEQEGQEAGEAAEREPEPEAGADSEMAMD